MTPQQHKQHLLALADALKYQLQIDANGELIGVSRQAVDEAVVELRNLAARLTPGVSDAMVEKALIAASAAQDDPLKWPTDYPANEQEESRRIMRKALEAVFPLVDEDKWQPISSAPLGRKLILGYRNKLGKWRTVTGRYYAENTLPSNDDSGHEEDEFAPAGWYEESENDCGISFTDEPPTHWMPLPSPPADAAMAAPPKDTTP